MEMTGARTEQLRITLYCRSWSISCWRIKRLLRRKGFAFDVIDVTGDASRARPMEITGSGAAPQLFIAGRLVGGYGALKALDRSVDLDWLVRGAV